MDNARNLTDKQLEVIEKRIAEIYAQAHDELVAKWNKFMHEQGQHIKNLQDQYYTTKNAGFTAEAKELGRQLGIAKKDLTLKNQYYKDMVDATTSQLAKVNQTALDYINGQMPQIYALNYNQAKETADTVGIRFDLINENVVMRRIIDDDITLPKKNIDIPKDQRWNTKQLNSSVLQGIIQGESMDDIAKRILPVVNNNYKAAIRNARTMVTGAENVGRLDSYKQLQDDGLILRKVWMATPDGRTRDWHVDMDGQEVEIDQYFIDGLGNELEYPGDPMGSPETVYNCRCTMITNVIGFKRNGGSVSMIDYEPEDETLHEQQMEVEKSRRKRRK